MSSEFQTFAQEQPESSPWPVRERVRMLLWKLAWAVFCGWTPKPLNRWRLFWLRQFGARLYGAPFVHPTAIIDLPWHLTMHDRSCLGERAHAYSLGEIEIGAHAIVAQEAYLCTGTHDFSQPSLPLQIAKITVGERAFIGARAFVLPGVTIGARAVVGACAVVTRDVAGDTINCGNPSRALTGRISPLRHFAESAKGSPRQSAERASARSS